MSSTCCGSGTICPKVRTSSSETCSSFEQEADLAGYDQVIFLAGLSNDPMAAYSPARNFVENGALPSYLAFIAKNAGVRRFIYASSCSIYGYTVNELYDEESPATCAYPYGISKLQGERGVSQLNDGDFSTIALRQGTVCGYSPRTRFDLIVNTMFKSAIADGCVTVNNPSIWRPILDVRDTSSAFLRAVQADYGISGCLQRRLRQFHRRADRRHGEGRSRGVVGQEGRDRTQERSGFPKLQGDVPARADLSRISAQVLDPGHREGISTSTSRSTGISRTTRSTTSTPSRSWTDPSSTDDVETDDS